MKRFEEAGAGLLQDRTSRARRMGPGLLGGGELEKCPPAVQALGFQTKEGLIGPLSKADIK